MTGAFRPPLVTPGPDVETRFLETVVANGPTGGGGRLFIDPELAQECIDRLKEAAFKLTDRIQVMERDLAFPAPGADVVSINAAEQGAVMAERAGAFAYAWRDQIASTVLALEAQLAAYQQTEAENRDTFA